MAKKEKIKIENDMQRVYEVYERFHIVPMMKPICGEKELSEAFNQFSQFYSKPEYQYSNFSVVVRK